MSLGRSRRRGNRQRENVEPVDTDLPGTGQPQPPLAMSRLRGRQDADIERHRLLAADALDLPLLQHAQQLGLQGQRHFGNFVEQQRAAVGLLELAGLGRLRAGEGALLVAEQCRFQQVVGNRRAVDGDERPLGARRLVVDVAGEHFLAGTRFAGQQHRGIGPRHARGQQQHLAGPRVGRDHALGRAAAWHSVQSAPAAPSARRA